MYRENADEISLNKELLTIFFNDLSLLNDKKKILFNLAYNYSQNVDALYKINKIIVLKEGIFTTENKELKFFINKDIATLIYNDERLDMNLMEFRQILVRIIDIVQEILPLGTVVALKKNYLNKQIQTTNIEKVRIVITHRFLGDLDEKLYFPYAGVVYPFGTFDKKEIIHFTPALIQEIVHRGYSDSQDKAYIYLMKKEFILENAMNSYGFASEEKLERF